MLASPSVPVLGDRVKQLEFGYFMGEDDAKEGMAQFMDRCTQPAGIVPGTILSDSINGAALDISGLRVQEYKGQY